MSKVLVATASRHGATAEIGTAIAALLRGYGLEVDVRRMEDVDTIYPYDAFVLGSAVYMGSWLRAAQRFVDEHEELIRSRPTWLFSSGPIGGAPNEAARGTFDAEELVEQTNARDHQLFAGRLDPEGLRLTERALAGMLRVPTGDFRDWAIVSAWSTGIARSLGDRLSA